MPDDLRWLRYAIDLSMQSLAEAPPRFVEPWERRRFLERLHPPMEVVGPLLEAESARPHQVWLERWLAQRT